MATKGRKPAQVDDWEAAPVSHAPGGGNSGSDDWTALNPSDQRARPIDLMKKSKELEAKFLAPDFAVDLANAGVSFVDTVTGRNLQRNPGWERAVQEAYETSPTAANVANKGTLLGLGVASNFVPGGLPAQIAIGGAQGLLERPRGEADGISIEERLTNAAFGAGIPIGLRGAGAGLKTLGDFAMQKALGTPGYLKGLGTRVANEGLIGTRGMMEKQAGTKLKAREAALDQAIDQVQGNISNQRAAQAVRAKRLGMIPRNPGMPMEPGNVEPVRIAAEREFHILSRPQVSARDTLDAVRKADKGLYDTSTASGKYAKEIAKTDTGAMREELKSEAERQGTPAVRKLLEREQALLMAADALESKGRWGEIARMAPGVALGGGVGYYTGDPWKGLLSAAAATPAGLSTIGQMGTQLGRVPPGLSQLLIENITRNRGRKPVGNGGENRQPQSLPGSWDDPYFWDEEDRVLKSPRGATDKKESDIREELGILQDSNRQSGSTDESQEDFIKRQAAERDSIAKKRNKKGVKK